jgi:hypothetical protein
MGCFSYLCKKCGKGINSSSFDGEECIIFLLKDGKPVEKMEGRYDSYGCVFTLEGKHELYVENEYDIEEINPQKTSTGLTSFNWQYKPWRNIIRQTIRTKQVGEYTRFIFDHEDGFAAYHKWCFDGYIPKTGSKSDPDQGWNDIKKEGPE